MKKIYESFTEIAEDFKRGDYWTHQYSDHTPDECIPWQHGIAEFAKWLDKCGVKIIKNPAIYNKLWGNLRNYKPKKYVKCSKEKNNERNK